MKRTDIKESRVGLLAKIPERIFDTLGGARFPNKDYESSVRTFGAELVRESDGKLVWKNTSMPATIDRKGDWWIRQFDDHIATDVGKIVKRHGVSSLLNLLASGPKRYRGTTSEIAQNIVELDLGTVYQPHPRGIEIVKPDLFEHGIPLQDIWRADLIKDDKLLSLDKEEALRKAARYIREIHENSKRGIGEVLSNDIVFSRDDNGALIDPALNIPDIVFNPEKSILPREQMALDVLDFMFSMGAEQVRKDNNADGVRKVFNTIVSEYDSSDEMNGLSARRVLRTVRSFLGRGRVTLKGGPNTSGLPSHIGSSTAGALEMHNDARFGSAKEDLRLIAMDMLDTVIN